MKKSTILSLLAIVLCSAVTFAQPSADINTEVTDLQEIQAENPPAVEYKVLTIIESVVPAGLGRSRLIETKSEIDVDAFTTERTDGKKSKQGDVKRKDAKVDAFAETKMLNFYSAVGINFQNIASNDAMIGDKINKMVADGWELEFVLSGVESDGGKGDGTGIYITRLIFKRNN